MSVALSMASHTPLTALGTFRIPHSALVSPELLQLPHVGLFTVAQPEVAVGRRGAPPRAARAPRPHRHPRPGPVPRTHGPRPRSGPPTPSGRPRPPGPRAPS